VPWPPFGSGEKFLKVLKGFKTGGKADGPPPLDGSGAENWRKRVKKGRQVGQAGRSAKNGRQVVASQKRSSKFFVVVNMPPLPVSKYATDYSPCRLKFPDSTRVRI
jgi:hypothetical protein